MSSFRGTHFITICLSVQWRSHEINLKGAKLNIRKKKKILDKKIHTQNKYFMQYNF